LAPGGRKKLDFAIFLQYIRNKVQVQFDGVEQAEAVDEHTGQIDEVMTIGNLLTIHGNGLKVVTQSSAKHGGSLLKNVRKIRSDFRLTVQN
jgi:hypothetical protein